MFRTVMFRYREYILKVVNLFCLLGINQLAGHSSSLKELFFFLEV